jgi:4-amino-4-deoxy-L-arabinose transferase-like glycosyltransferase
MILDDTATPAQPTAPAGRSAHVGTWVLLSIALALRLLWRVHEPSIAQGEECEYLRLAQNLFTTGHYVGLEPGTQLMYPPLLPILICLLFPVTGSFQAAAAVVTLAAGLLLVVAVRALATQMYGSRVGVVAGVLAALYPVLIELCDVTYSESVYLPLFVAGVLYGLRWIGAGRRTWALLSGACFGLAYLTRPEALYLSVIVSAVFVARATLQHRSRITASIVGVLPFLGAVAVLAAPYVVFLSLHTGSLRLETKTVMNYTIGQRINAGMNRKEASLYLGPDLREEGPHLSPNEWLLAAPAAIPPAQLLSYWLSSAHRNFGPVRWMVLSAVFGTEVLLVLLLGIGLLAPPWGWGRLFSEFAVIAIVAGYLVILLGQHEIQLRFAVPQFVLTLVWLSRGICLIHDWLANALRRLHIAPRPAGWVGALGYVLPTVLLLAEPVRVAVAEGSNFRITSPLILYEKQAGLWLAQLPKPPQIVMSTNDEVSYYSGSHELKFPYASERLALEYMRLKAPDYMVVTREPGYINEYYVSWFERGIPNPAIVLVHTIGNADGPQALIYTWRGMRSASLPATSSGTTARARP